MTAAGPRQGPQMGWVLAHAGRHSHLQSEGRAEVPAGLSRGCPPTLFNPWYLTWSAPSLVQPGWVAKRRRVH